LNKSRANGTLTEFVLNTVVPLINAVGEAWSQKEIEIYHEHICTSVIQRLLHAEILSCKPKRGFPRILFATPPDEHHVLGLLMTEAVFADHGATTLCVGSNTPLHDLKMATISWKADIVALSFSFAYSSRNVRPTLLHVRRLLPPQVEIWAGGAGLAKMRQPPKGICTFSDIQESVGALLRFSKLKLN
jgi:methanogenic corrinoid protein MtbC1